MELPNQLRLMIERELRGGGAALAREAAALSADYRAAGRAGTLSATTAMAYAATRMPATYAAASAALHALARGLPAFAPATQLDLGAGTGAALWAATSRWPELAAATLIEREPAMIALGQRLAASSAGVLSQAQWRQADLLGPWEAPQHDLVTATYMLGELPDQQRAALVARLWERAAGALVLVEPGTPRGWATIRAVREQLRAAGAMLVAPCPHQGPCPMPADDWCHFAQRIARTRAHRAAKGAALGYEDEKFSYVAAARVTPTPIAARVLRHPTVRPGHIQLALCADDGLRQVTVSRGSGSGWRLARDLRWGDTLPPGALEET